MLLSFEGLSPSDEVEFTTVAAPIFDPIGRVLLSLCITGPDHTVSVDRILELGRRLVQSAGDRDTAGARACACLARHVSPGGSRVP